jgi:hypothetical protein
MVVKIEETEDWKGEDGLVRRDAWCKVTVGGE